MSENVIALIYDFDRTLSPIYAPDVLFKNCGGKDCWKEFHQKIQRAEERGINLDQECAYLNLILEYGRNGKLPPLSNEDLREMGKEIPLFPGLPEFLQQTKDFVESEPKNHRHDITLEHYVISTAPKELMVGSAIGSYVNGIFGSEFNVDEEGKICEIARTMGSARKVEFLHVINKGVNVDPQIDVNGFVPTESRRIPFRNMVYLGDGPTDVPCFATLNKKGGTSLAVYDPTSEDACRQAYVLRRQNRIFETAPAIYTPESHLSCILRHILRDIADCIVERREHTMSHLNRGAPAFTR